MTDTTPRQFNTEQKKQRAEAAKRYRERHPDRVKASRKKISLEQRVARVEQIRNWCLKHRYNITPEQYEELLTRQNASCAICFRAEAGGRGGWHVDHCHETSVVRGLLCHHCNLMLGNARDNPDILFNAISYLKAN